MIPHMVTTDETRTWSSLALEARSAVESSSTSELSAAAQNRATRSASTQSNVRFLMYDGMLLPP